MKILQSPQEQTIVFLAGGITNCDDWQSGVIRELSVLDDNLLLVNPRKADFDMSDPAESIRQIAWEFDYLHKAHAVLFWFPPETLCPITLYELGFHAAKGTPLFVGTHQDYKRRLDVEQQLKHARPDIAVRSSIKQVTTDLSQWYANRRIGK